MSSDVHFPDWPRSSYVSASDAHLHALGVISLSYTRLEHAMSVLFCDFMTTDKAISEALFARLSNNERSNILKLLSEQCKAEESSHLAHAVECYDVCTENRNTLAHIADDCSSDDPMTFLGRKMNSAKTKINFYPLGLTTLRQVADDMIAAYEFAMAISFYRFCRHARARATGQEAPSSLVTLILEHGPTTLREKPPLPSKLSPLPPA
jgi:hypothetical protein